MAGAGGRNFGRALAISLSLHAVLLWQVLSTATGSLQQMQATSRPTALSAVLQPSNATPLAVTAEPEKTTARAKPLPAVAQQAEPPGLALPVAAVPQTAGESSASAALSDDAALDANGVRQYRVSLAATARRFRKFPAQALASGLSGTAEVRIAIVPSGLPQAPQLQRSSGHDLLDAAALQMIGDAVQNTSVPPSLRGQSFNVQLPVEFGINDEARE